MLLKSMLTEPGAIRPLPEDVAAQIKSSVAISSLSYAVLGLIENALDAGAININVTVDFGNGACCVEDDGNGILPADFTVDGGLAKPHHTSNAGGDARRNGRHGTFLSSLAALAILTVTSRHASSNSTNTLMYHHSRAAARLMPAPSHHQLAYRNHGTRVQLQDLFGNMPVRVKQRPSTDDARKVRGKDWEWLCKHVTGILLAWDNPITVTARGHDKDQLLRFRTQISSRTLSAAVSQARMAQKSFDIDLIRDTLHQGANIDLSDWNTWVKTSARTPFMTIRGMISLQPVASKETQFVCLGLKHISSDGEYNILYDEVNALFASSSFGVQEESNKSNGPTIGRRDKYKRLKMDEITQKQLRGCGKGIDRWPMFFIRIDLQAGFSPPLMTDCNATEQNNSLLSIVKVLEAMVVGFLAEHHLRPRKGRSRKLTDPGSHASNPHGQLFATPFLVKKSSLNKTYRLKTIEPVSGDLSSKVKIPAFSNIEDLGPRADFSRWSRIKGLSRDINSVAPKDQAPVNRIKIPTNVNDAASTYKVNQLSHSDFSMAKLCSVTPRSSQPVPRLQEDISNIIDPVSKMACNTITAGPGHESQNDSDTQSGDASLIWTNPLSKLTVKINARTGSVICNKHESQSSKARSVQPTGLARGLGRNNIARQTPSRRFSNPCLRPKEGSWAEVLLNSWANPVFHHTEKAIPRISFEIPDRDTGRFSSHQGGHQCSQFHFEDTFTNASTQLAVKLDKVNLGYGKVIAQVDKKFILVKIASLSLNNVFEGSSSEAEDVLVLVDQHAADERICVEALLADLCTGASPTTVEMTSPLGLHSSIETTKLPTPISFNVNKREFSLFERHAAVFAKWGILYNLCPRKLTCPPWTVGDLSTVTVLTLPAAIAERCRVDVKQLIGLLRGEAWRREEAGSGRTTLPDTSRTTDSDRCGSFQTQISQTQEPWSRLIHDCPPGILDMLNSRSCRSAIMFNDELRLEDSEALIQKLARCSFPFQCAHGRPSMVPLVRLDATNNFVHNGQKANKVRRASRASLDYREAWKILESQ